MNYEEEVLERPEEPNLYELIEQLLVEKQEMRNQM